MLFPTFCRHTRSYALRSLSSCISSIIKHQICSDLPKNIHCSTPGQIYRTERCENSHEWRQRNQKHTIIATAGVVNLVHDLLLEGTSAKSVVCSVGRFFPRSVCHVWGISALSRGVLLLYAPVRKRSFTSFLLGPFPPGLSISSFYASSFDQGNWSDAAFVSLVDGAFLIYNQSYIVSCAEKITKPLQAAFRFGSKHPRRSYVLESRHFAEHLCSPRCIPAHGCTCVCCGRREPFCLNGAQLESCHIA